MLPAIVAVCLATAPDASVPAGPPVIDVSNDPSLKARKAAFELSRQGKYDEAGAALEDAGFKNDQKLAAAYRARGQLALKAPKDKNSAWLLLQSLVDNPSYDIERTNLSDPRAQALLDHIRKLDPKAKALFGPRKVKVVVESDALKETHKAFYVQELVANLRLLGIAASSEEGDDVFKVVHSEGKHLDVDFGGPMPGVKGCEAVAVATWTNKKGKVEMAALDLGKRAPGFTDIPDNCLKAPLKPSAVFAPIMILRNWAAR